MAQKGRTSPFMLTSDATPYLKKLEKTPTGKIEQKMVFWWLCAQVGILYNKKAEVPRSSSDMTVSFVKALLPHATHIRGLLLWRDLHRQDVNIENRDALERTIENTLGEGENKLSTKGVKSLNEYASGGFNIIKNKIKSPDNLLNFLIKYNDLLKGASKKA